MNPSLLSLFRIVYGILVSHFPKVSTALAAGLIGGCVATQHVEEGKAYRFEWSPYENQFYCVQKDGVWWNRVEHLPPVTQHRLDKLNGASLSSWNHNFVDQENNIPPAPVTPSPQSAASQRQAPSLSQASWNPSPLPPVNAPTPQMLAPVPPPAPDKAAMLAAGLKKAGARKLGAVGKPSGTRGLRESLHRAGLSTTTLDSADLDTMAKWGLDATIRSNGTGYDVLYRNGRIEKY